MGRAWSSRCVPAGSTPTVDDALARLTRLAELGPTATHSRSRPCSHRPTTCRPRPPGILIVDVVIAPAPGHAPAPRLIGARPAPGFALPACRVVTRRVGRLLEEGVEFSSCAPATCRPPAAVPVVDAPEADSESYGEVNRMLVVPAFRGAGFGKQILARLAGESRGRGIDVLRLETGMYEEEAIGLYERTGFRRIGPFGPYIDDPLCAYFEMRLDRAGAGEASRAGRPDRAPLRPEDADQRDATPSGVQTAAQALGTLLVARVIDADGRIRVEDLLTAGAAVCGDSSSSAAASSSQSRTNSFPARPSCPIGSTRSSARTRASGRRPARACSARSMPVPSPGAIPRPTFRSWRTSSASTSRCWAAMAPTAGGSSG